MEFFQSRSKVDSGQSIVETALVMPLILLIIFNAVNFGYYFYVAIHLASAPRQGVEYSIQGFSSPKQLSLPNAGPSTSQTSVSWLTFQDMAGLISASNQQVQVCSKNLGLSAPGKPNCQQFPAGATFPTPNADPEPAFFVLNRLDVRYTVSPIIPVNLFGLTLTPSANFHRQVSMRALD